MCTVLFIPSKEKLYFASLRDENPNRLAAVAPIVWEQALVKFIAPKDEKAGGTWVGVNTFSTVIILLNGGFENHIRTDAFIKSRGLIVTELLSSLYPIEDWGKIDLNNIEPFTLIVWNNLNLYQLVWDGISKHSIQLNPDLPHLFSSSTLYSNEAKKIREALFNDWISNNPDFNVETVLHFFNSFPDSFNGFIMNRNEKLKTLSYSFLEILEKCTATMHYHNFQNNTHQSLTIGLVALNMDPINN